MLQICLLDRGILFFVSYISRSFWGARQCSCSWEFLHLGMPHSRFFLWVLSAQYSIPFWWIRVASICKWPLCSFPSYFFRCIPTCCWCEVNSCVIFIFLILDGCHVGLTDELRSIVSGMGTCMKTQKICASWKFTKCPNSLTVWQVVCRMGQLYGWIDPASITLTPRFYHGCVLGLSWLQEEAIMEALQSFVTFFQIHWYSIGLRCIVMHLKHHVSHAFLLVWMAAKSHLSFPIWRFAQFQVSAILLELSARRGM